jgi:hypothetical protein
MADKHIIYPTHSPVDRLGGESLPAPLPMRENDYKIASARLLRKLSPLLRAREEADKVYSNGYFENHYPEADKKVKRLLHNRVMAAWANALNDSCNDDNKFNGGLGNGGVTININVGG